MAIYHFKSQIIKRSAGRSATSAAAYRARTKIRDDRTGLTFDYRHIDPASHLQILAPDNAPSWVYDRASLWNEVEKAEKRKDSQLAKEIMVALPKELTRSDRIKLGQRFIQDTYVSRGMIADLAFHDLDSQNPHMHVMLTTRTVDATGFGKKERNWNPKFKRGKAKGDCLEKERQLWQDYTNKALENAGYAEVRVDCRSLAARGSDFVPQIHLGAAANALERKGIPTARGDEHRRIAQVNAEIAKLKIKLEITEAQIEEEKELLERKIRKQQQELSQKKTESTQVTKNSQKNPFLEKLFRNDYIVDEPSQADLERGSISKSKNSANSPTTQPLKPVTESSQKQQKPYKSKLSKDFYNSISKSKNSANSPIAQPKKPVTESNKKPQKPYKSKLSKDFYNSISKSKNSTNSPTAQPKKPVTGSMGQQQELSQKETESTQVTKNSQKNPFLEKLFRNHYIVDEASQADLERESISKPKNPTNSPTAQPKKPVTGSSEKQYQRPKSVQASPPTPNPEEQLQLARQILTNASQIYEETPSQEKRLIKPNIWQIQGQYFAITFDGNQRILNISHSKRGVLFEANLNKNPENQIAVHSTMFLSDLEAFQYRLLYLREEKKRQEKLKQEKSKGFGELEL